jgi:predicted RNase H-like HicB family nuclease
MSDEHYTVRVHDEGGDGYRLWAEVDELPGLFASGRDHDELLEALTETIGGYLSEPGHDVHIEDATEVFSEDDNRIELSVRLVESEQNNDAGRPRYADPMLDDLSRRIWALRFKEGRRVMDDDVARDIIARAATAREVPRGTRTKGQRETG